MQDLFERASKSLFMATENRTYFSSVDIWLLKYSHGTGSYTEPSPSHSTHRAEPDLSNPKESPDILVDFPNAAYGDLPYTVQTKGCGERGDFIHLTEGFLLNPRKMTLRFGPQESLIVHEWIKYQYGVFDENGIPWDPVHPQKYYGTGGTQLYNTCNSTQITFTER